MMNEDKVTTIIAADYMYLVFLGDRETIERIADKLNKNIEELDKNLEKNKSYKTHKFNRANKNKEIYVKYEVGDPCVGMLEEEHIENILIEDAKKSIHDMKNKTITAHDIDMYKKYIVLDEGVETAQCLTYADISSNDIMALKGKCSASKLMMLMVMTRCGTYYKLSYPILQLDEEENPDKLISKWLKEHNLENIVKELTIRPVNIVGNEHDILVFTAFVNN
jgi:hypothetical protein